MGPSLDAVIIATSGTGVLLTLPDMEPEKPTRNVLTPGSFAFVPAWTEHRIVNERDEGELRWTIVQNGNEPLSVDLESWAGSPIKTRQNGAVNGEKIGESEKKGEEGRMGYCEAVTATVGSATEPQDLGRSTRPGRLWTLYKYSLPACGGSQRCHPYNKALPFFVSSCCGSPSRSN